MRPRAYPALLALGLLACRNAPVSPGPATPKATMAWRVAALGTEWSKTFAPSGRHGVCPQHWVAASDGTVFMVGHFDGELNLDAIRLESTSEAAYLARLSPQGSAEWAVALPAPAAAQEPLSVTQLALFGDGVFVTAGVADGPAARFSYTKAGAPGARRELGTGEATFAVLLDRTSWVVEQPTPHGTMLVRYQDESGKSWQKEYSSSQTVAPSSSADGRIASVGDFDEEPATRDAFDQVSVLSKHAGNVLFRVALPGGARVAELGFDANNRLWISGSVEDGPFVQVLGPKGEDVATLSLSGAGADIADGPVFLADGRAVLGLRASQRVTLTSSFAGTTEFGPEEALIEIDLDRKRATRYRLPANTACLAPTPDGNVLGCVQHRVKQGQFSWPARCDLVKWKLEPPSSRGTP